MVDQLRYTTSGFYTVAREVGQRLGELRYIDQALDYLEEIRHSVDEWERRATQPLMTPPRPSYMEVDLGTTHPFDVTTWVRPSHEYDEGTGAPDRDEVLAHIDGLRGPAMEWGEGIVEGLRAQVEDLTDPLVANFTVRAEALENEIQIPFDTLIPSDFGELRNTLPDWDGEAAENFATAFYNPMIDIVENQAWVAAELGKLVAGCAATINLGRNSLSNTFHVVNLVLDQQLEKRMEQNRDPSFAETLKMISVAAGILAVIAIPVAGLATGAGAVSAITGYASEALDNDASADVLRIESSSAEDIAEKLGEEITSLMSDHDSHWRALKSERIDVLAGHVENIIADGLLSPERPDIADSAPGDGDFEHQSAA